MSVVILSNIPGKEEAICFFFGRQRVVVVVVAAVYCLT